MNKYNVNRYYMLKNSEDLITLKIYNKLYLLQLLLRITKFI